MTNLRARLAEALAMAAVVRTDEDSQAVDYAVTVFMKDPALDRALEDAERYRWLRDLPEGSPHEHIGNLPGDMWDTAIDAARKKP